MKHLVWMDLEMSGLDPEKDVIIEIATVITDSELNVVAVGPDMAIRQEELIYSKMDKWNQEHHMASGLWNRVQQSKTSIEEAETLTLDFIKQYSKAQSSPLCGNSVWQDRRFLARYMKRIEQHLHYRLIDVSTLKQLVKIWLPDLYEKTKEKANRHRALDDVFESINELKIYRSILFDKGNPGLGNRG